MAKLPPAQPVERLDYHDTSPPTRALIWAQNNQARLATGVKDCVAIDRKEGTPMFGFRRMKSAILVLCALIAVALPACTAVETEVRETAPAEVAEEATNMPAPTAKPTTAAGPAIYQMGIFAEPISRNYWNYYGGPAGSVWTGYVLAGYATALYGYSDQRFDWVPSRCLRLPNRAQERDCRRR